MAARRKPALVQMGVDEIHLGKKQKFITVVSNLDASEPVWFGRERKKETLDEFFQKELSAGQRMRIAAACVDMWEPYRLSIEQWAPNCRIVYDNTNPSASLSIWLPWPWCRFRQHCRRTGGRRLQSGGHQPHQAGG